MAGKQRRGGAAAPPPGPPHDSPEPVEAEFVGGEGLHGLAVIQRAENATMVDIAHRYPRNAVAIRRAAMQELEQMEPDEAAELYYSIPYKENKGTPNERTVYVEGPSVHLAQDLAQRWQHVTHDAREVQDEEDRVIVQGVFVDWQNNVRVGSTMLVSKFLTMRGGQVVRLSEDRLMKAVAATMQKARRNAILAGLPRGFVQKMWARAKEIAEAKAPVQTPEARAAQWVEWFKPHGVSQKVIEDHFGKPLAQLNDEDYGRLRGIANAIKDGFAEPLEAFAMGTERAGTPDPAAGGPAPQQQTLNDVIKGRAE